MGGQIEAVPQDAAMAAAEGGLDEMAKFVSEHMGTNVWARAVHNAPDDWEVEEMIVAVRDCLRKPAKSAYMWLLAKPTRIERIMIDLSSTTAGKSAAKRARLNESAAATIIQKHYRGR